MFVLTPLREISLIHFIVRKTTKEIKKQNIVGAKIMKRKREDAVYIVLI